MDPFIHLVQTCIINLEMVQIQIKTPPLKFFLLELLKLLRVNNHSLILKTDGSLHTFGKNTNGQLGDGTTTSKSTPTQILASGVAQIAAGYTHSLILKTDGSLHAFGYNLKGQLGDGTTVQKNVPTQILASGVAQIAAGYYHSLILKTDGSLHAFGYNHYGQLGDGTNTDRNSPTQILASGVAQISAGRYHSLIVKTDGSLHAFGYNNYGQLGDGTNTDRNTPTQILVPESLKSLLLDHTHLFLKLMDLCMSAEQMVTDNSEMALPEVKTPTHKFLLPGLLVCPSNHFLKVISSRFTLLILLN